MNIIKKYKMIIVLMIITFFILVLPNFVQAGGLKAERLGGTYLATLTPEEFFTLIRQMQSPTGTLGVSSSDGNKINCHMQKTTEIGTVMILGNSKYGSNNSASSNGNDTGVSGLNERYTEFTTGVLENTKFTDVPLKYKNIYSESKVSYNGDELEKSNFRLNSENPIYVLDSPGRYLCYSNGNKINMYSAYAGTFSGYKYTGTVSRAVVVNGDGI